MKTLDHKGGAYLDIDTARIYYEVAGTADKPVLLILHGGLGTLQDTAAIHKHLYPVFTIIGIDSRGNGKSTLGETGLTYERDQKDVELVLRHLKIDTLSVLGFSDGGIVAYRLAAFTKLNIQKLITIGASWHYKNIAPTKPIFEKLTAKSWTEKFPDTVMLYNQLNPEPNFEKLVEAAKIKWLDDDTSGHPNEAVGKIAAPLFIIRGDKDHLTNATDVAEIASIVKNTSTFIVPFANHDAFNQQPEVISKFILQFLSSKSH